MIWQSIEGESSPVYGRAWNFTLGFSRPINVFIWNARMRLHSSFGVDRFFSIFFPSFFLFGCLLPFVTILKYDSTQVYLYVLLLFFLICFLLFRSLWFLLPTFKLLIDLHLYHWSSNKLVFFRKRVCVCVHVCFCRFDFILYTLVLLGFRSSFHEMLKREINLLEDWTCLGSMQSLSSS